MWKTHLNQQIAKKIYIEQENRMLWVDFMATNVDSTKKLISMNVSIIIPDGSYALLKMIENKLSLLQLMDCRMLAAKSLRKAMLHYC